MIPLNKLEVFKAVCSAGSFSGAAKLLYMSQSAVSQHIRDVEMYLGTPLFERAGSRGVTCTESGKVLLQYANEVIRLLVEAENRLTVVENLPGGQITVGVTPGVSLYLFPGWLHGFKSKYPNLTVELKTSITQQIVSSVLANEVDYGFVEGELDDFDDSNLSHLKLKPIEIKLVMSKAHHWANRGFIQFAELDGEAFVTRHPRSRTRQWIDSVFRTHRITPHIVAEFDNPETIKNGVRANMGCALLPEYAVTHELANGELVTIDIEEITMERYLKLIWNRENAFTPVAASLLRHLETTFTNVPDILPPGTNGPI